LVSEAGPDASCKKESMMNLKRIFTLAIVGASASLIAFSAFGPMGTRAVSQTAIGVTSTVAKTSQNASSETLTTSQSQIGGDDNGL
jgi:hypothetical protein